MGWTTEELRFDSRHEQEIFLCKIWSFHSCRLQPPAHAGSTLVDFCTLKMEAICFSGTSVHTRSTRCHIPEDGIHQEIFLCKILSFHSCRLQPPAHAGSSLADFSTLKMEALCFSETSVHTRSTWRHIPEDGIRQEIFLFSTTIRKALGLSCWYRGLLLWGWSEWGLKMTIWLNLRVPILIMHIDKPSFLHTYVWCLCTEISLSCIWKRKENLSQSYSRHYGLNTGPDFRRRDWDGLSGDYTEQK
jgi:hypothetical protein